MASTEGTNGAGKRKRKKKASFRIANLSVSYIEVCNVGEELSSQYMHETKQLECSEGDRQLTPNCAKKTEIFRRHMNQDPFLFIKETGIKGSLDQQISVSPSSTVERENTTKRAIAHGLPFIPYFWIT